MPQLSDDELKQIATHFHDVGVSVGESRLKAIHQGTPLNDARIVRLLGLQWNLINTSSSFYVQAAQVTLANADVAEKSVTDATTQANEAIKTINDINKAITIGSSVAVLAPAIYSGDMKQVGAAVKGVWDAIKG